MFDEDEELASDEEEVLVYVEFDGSVAGNTFSNEKLNLDMIGLDKEHPIMQVNGKFYEGTYQDAVGTYMFFEKDKNPPVDDPVFDSIPNIKYCAKTRKVLKMHRIFVEPKTDMLGDSNDAEFVPNMETIRRAGVPPRYQDAALQSWETMRSNRMDALNTYLEKQRIREEKRAHGIEPDSESDNDNPFAVYKPDSGEKKMKRPENDSNVTEDHSQFTEDGDIEKNVGDSKNICQNSQTLTIMDPGPSTSKDSKPWSSPSTRAVRDSECDSDDTYHVNPTNVASKHKATIKVAKKGLKRAFKKTPNKKGGNQPRKSNKKEDFDWEETNEIDEARAAELLSKDLESLLNVNGNDSKTKTANDSIELPEGTGDGASCKSELESIVAKRKMAKQQKREEKMKLISEKFKMAVEESRLRAQEHHKGDI